jgi:Bacterial regulatory protein, Fis family
MRLGVTAGASEPMTLDGVQRGACIRALEKTGGNVARAARILGGRESDAVQQDAALQRRYSIAPPAEAAHWAAARARGWLKVPLSRKSYSWDRMQVATVYRPELGAGGRLVVLNSAA